MYSNKSVMIERINIAIHKNWQLEDTSATGQEFTREFIDALGEFNTRHRRKQEANMSLGKEMALRIDALEDQNDQLLYFINFLIEHLPNLVEKILIAELKELKRKTPLQVQSDCDAGKSPLLPDYFGHDEEPCPTRREKDVLDLLVKGYCAKEIAKKLFISEATVVTHKKNLKEKFCAKNTVELISKAHSYVTMKGE